MFDLASDGPSIVAATNGGLLRFDGQRWTALEDTPAGIRTIESLKPLSLTLADGRTIGQGQRERNPENGILIDPDQEPKLPIPAPAQPYALLQKEDGMLLGTNDGLYRLQGNRWQRETLPSDCPISRPNGIARIGDTYVVGGLGGLFMGHPGHWTGIAKDAIRQIAAGEKEVWVVHGNGAVDKIDPAADRIYPDLLSGTSKRPWTSCLATDGDLVLFGGYGGWAERGRQTSETHPPEMAGDVVTALAAKGKVRWVATQKSGLFRYGAGKRQTWNPGNGLPDTWVTVLRLTKEGLVVGTARQGLFLLKNDRLSPLQSPTQRVTALTEWRGKLVVGGMDGAWVREGQNWKPLPTESEETTSLSTGDGPLKITTAAGIFFRP